MKIIKRDGRSQDYLPGKIQEAIRKAFLSVDGSAPESTLLEITQAVETKIKLLEGAVQVESVPASVEQINPEITNE